MPPSIVPSRKNFTPWIFQRRPPVPCHSRKRAQSSGVCLGSIHGENRSRSGSSPSASMSRRRSKGSSRKSIACDDVSPLAAMSANRCVTRCAWSSIGSRGSTSNTSCMASASRRCPVGMPSLSTSTRDPVGNVRGPEIPAACNAAGFARAEWASKKRRNMGTVPTTSSRGADATRSESPHVGVQSPPPEPVARLEARERGGQHLPEFGQRGDVTEVQADREARPGERMRMAIAEPRNDGRPRVAERASAGSDEPRHVALSADRDDHPIADCEGGPHDARRHRVDPLRSEDEIGGPISHPCRRRRCARRSPAASACR